MPNFARPETIALSFIETMENAPIDLNLKDDGKGIEGVAYTVAPISCDYAPTYRDKRLVGAWLVGYLYGMHDTQDKEN